MSGIDRFDRRLGDRLLDVAALLTSDYLDDVLAVTARTRQRSAWTFPGRWFPVTEIATRPVVGPSLPWRPIAIVLVVVAVILAAVAAVFVGSHRLPAPRTDPPGTA